MVVGLFQLQQSHHLHPCLPYKKDNALQVIEKQCGMQRSVSPMRFKQEDTKGLNAVQVLKGWMVVMNTGRSYIYA